MQKKEQESKNQTKDSTYIQQHLANERTYLAWVRTSITIIGVGFLITNLHFATLTTPHVDLGDMLAKLIGLSSIIVGIITLIFTTFSYFKKGEDINQQTFRFTRITIILLTILMTLIFIVFGAYYLIMWALI